MPLDSIRTPNLAIYAGGIVIAGSTAYVVTQSGHIFSPHSALLACLAFGIFAAAYVLGEGRIGGRKATLLIAALIGAEAFNLLQNSESLVETREAEQAPLRKQADAYDAAQRAIDQAKASPASSPRLVRADAALQAARSGSVTSRTEAAERALKAANAAVDNERLTGCKAACRDKIATAEQSRQDLQRAIEADARERVRLIAAAESEASSALAEAQELKRQRIVKAEATFASTAKPPSATALADRLHMSGGALDLLAAVSLSIAALGLGATLVGIGSGELARSRSENSDIAGQSDYSAIAASDPALQAIFAPLLNSEHSGYSGKSRRKPKGKGPKKPTPPGGGGRRRGRKMQGEVVNFSDRFREKHGRAPSGKEIRAAFPALPRSTAYDYSDRAQG